MQNLQLGKNMKTIYVGNINYQATEEDLKNVFSEYGEVTSVK